MSKKGSEEEEFMRMRREAMGGSVRFGIRLNASTITTLGSAHHPEDPSPPDSHTGTPLLVAMTNTWQRQLKETLSVWLTV